MATIFIKRVLKNIFSGFSRTSKVQLRKRNNIYIYIFLFRLKRRFRDRIRFYPSALAVRCLLPEDFFSPFWWQHFLIFQDIYLLNTDVICSPLLLPWECLKAFVTQTVPPKSVIYPPSLLHIGLVLRYQGPL